ncbi:SDR family NAD(P)-dependent oxidoreductase [Actinokineospora sp. NPDC004072]
MTAVALVTGGGVGVGAAVAHRLDALGVRVAVLDGDSTSVELTGSALCRGMAVHADAADPVQVDDAVAAVVEHYGRLDLLVVTADVGCPAVLVDPTQVTDDEWHIVLAAQLDSAFYGVRAGLRAMRGRGGHIVAVHTDCPHLPQRAAASGGVAAMVRAAALAGDGVRVDAVPVECPPDPGAVATAVARIAVPVKG